MKKGQRMRITNEEVEEREAYARDMFRKDPGLSGPAANAVLKRRFKSSMRAQTVYELRAEIWKELGLVRDRFGRPVQKNSAEAATERLPGVPSLKPSTTAGQPLQEAHRNGNGLTSRNELLAVTVPLVGPGQGQFLADAIEILNIKGMTALKVDHIGDGYAVVKNR